MKKNLLVLAAIVALVGLFGCKGGAEETPVYKFNAKVNSTSWATDMIMPSTTPTEAVYVYNLVYYSGSKYIYLEARNPKNGNELRMRIYISSPANAVGVYKCSEGDFVPSFDLSTYDVPTTKSRIGQFEITKFSYNLSTGKITAFSGKFSCTLEQEHSDGYTRTTTITEGEVNNLVQL